VLFHEFAEDGVLALDLGFEALDELILGVIAGLGLATVGEGEVAVLEELFEPVVELVGVDVELIAQVRNGDLVDEVPFEDGDLLGVEEITTLLAHGEPPLGLYNPDGVFFQIRLRQNKTKSISR
jgi:hypothetical protein